MFTEETRQDFLVEFSLQEVLEKSFFCSCIFFLYNDKLCIICVQPIPFCFSTVIYCHNDIFISAVITLCDWSLENGVSSKILSSDFQMHFILRILLFI